MNQHVGPTSPGQIKNDITNSERKQNSFDRYPYMKHSTAEPLSEKPKKKLTFEEWAVSKGYGYWVSLNTFGWNSLYFNEEDVRSIWKAAQENA